ncbi:ATP-dependent helicase [soil metagenome]
MRILLAGPGTGKTTNIKQIIDAEFKTANRIIVLSFTNFTVNDLKENFADPKYQNIECSTLHKFAMKLNHLKDHYILGNKEVTILGGLAKALEINILDLFTQLKCITFDEMIARCLAFVEVNPAYVQDILGAVDLLLVDEFQDFNPNEQALILHISKIASETIILGDDDQSIYGFKDAKPDGIISIFEDSTVTKISHDNICYRCPDKVVEHATALIAKNKQRIAKDWKKNGKAGDVSFHQFANLNDSNAAILSKVRGIRENEPDASILILSRWKIVVSGLKEMFKDNGIEFRDCWFEEHEDALYEKIWWLNAIYGSHRIPFLIFLLKVNHSLTKAKARDLVAEGLGKGFNETALIDVLTSKKFLSGEFLTYLSAPLPIEDFFVKHKDYEEIEPYINSLDLKRSLTNLTQALLPNKDFAKGEINLMSIHKSKGLQADYVFINGLVAGIIPNEAEGFDSIEAERRLLFVAITRAGKELILYATYIWDGATLNKNKADKDQFEYRFWTPDRDYSGKASTFISEMDLKASIS